MPAHVIHKGISTVGLLAQVLVAKYTDHLPPYRQQGIFEQPGLALLVSTVTHWVSAYGAINYSLDRWGSLMR